MAVRTSNLKNFKGENLATEKFVNKGFVATLAIAPTTVTADSVATFYFAGTSTDTYKKGHTYQLVENSGTYSYSDLGGGGDDLIDPNTGNLYANLNPVAIASMSNTTGESDISKVKFIGNCKVSYGTDGQITIRIGDNLNCSLFNGTDGISTTTVSSSKSGDSAGYVSADYSSTSTADGNTSRQIFGSGGSISATCGSTASTTAGATDGTNGNEVHFDDNTAGNFKITIAVAGSDITYNVGPITGNGTYKAKILGNETEINGLTCTITNFGEEPKSATGATGYSGNVSFSLVPYTLIDYSADFQFKKIEMYEGETLAATWTNATTNGTYFVLKDSDGASLTSADYTITKSTKQISGVTYLTTSSTVAFTASGVKNIGYPAYVGNKMGCAGLNGSTDTKWFGNEIKETSKDAFTTWTTVKDTAMTWASSSTPSLVIGLYSNPQAKVYGINYLGNSNAVTTSKSDNAIMVCDSNGYVASTHGSISETNRLNADYENAGSTFASTSLLEPGNTDLQIYNGYVCYPKTDYSSYNKNDSTAINPNYTTCSGTRYYYCKLSKSGTIMGGTVTLTTAANPSSDISSNNLIIEISKNGKDSWMDIGKFASNGENASGNPYIGSALSFGTTASTLGFTIPQTDLYGTNEMFVRIAMTASASAQIANITLA